MGRIVLYSDQPVLVRGLEALINTDRDLDLRGWCSDLADLQTHLASKPELLLVDLTPEITIPVLHEIKNLARECKIILWTSSISPELALQSLTMGVRGILRKNLPLEAHLRCLRAVQAGELWFEKTITDSFRNSKRVNLTPRESQLVSLLARGLKNKEISTELGITEGSVKVYLSHLYQKAGFKDRLDLALCGLKNGSQTGSSGAGAPGPRTLVMNLTGRAESECLAPA